MRWLLSLALALSAFVMPVTAATTKDFLYRCALDGKACADKIREVARVIERPPPGQRAPVRICFPAGQSDDDLAEAVTAYIDNQSPPWDNRNDFDSIAAALTALYACDGIKGLEDYE
jgi:hypothetical protein